MTNQEIDQLVAIALRPVQLVIAKMQPHDAERFLCRACEKVETLLEAIMEAEDRPPANELFQ